MRGEEMLALEVGIEGEKSSTSVLADIDRVLEKAIIELHEIDIFAVAIGPGSFTGLRSGIATIQAFASTIGRPSIGIPTLHAIAHVVGPSSNVCALIPAGRGEIYAQLLALEQDGTITEREAPVHIKPATLIEKFGGIVKDLTFAGSGARLIQEALADKRSQEGSGQMQNTAPGILYPENDWRFIVETGALAPSIATLALKADADGNSLFGKVLKPLYVRPSDAELNERCRA